MAFFCVSYDLIKGKDYPLLIDRLKEYDSVKAQLSFWLVASADTGAALKADLALYVDDDDMLMVIEFTKRPNFTKALAGTNAWLDSHF